MFCIQCCTEFSIAWLILFLVSTYSAHHTSVNLVPYFNSLFLIMRCEAERNEFEEMIEDFEASGTTVISAFRLNRAGENLMLSKLALEMEFSTGKNPSR